MVKMTFSRFFLSTSLIKLNHVCFTDQKGPTRVKESLCVVGHSNKTVTYSWFKDDEKCSFLDDSSDNRVQHKFDFE